MFFFLLQLSFIFSESCSDGDDVTMEVVTWSPGQSLSLPLDVIWFLGSSRPDGGGTVRFGGRGRGGGVVLLKHHGGGG